MYSISQPEDTAIRNQLTLPVEGTIGAVEAAIENFFQDLPEASPSLELDLSACEFIEVPTLIYLIAFVKNRLNKGQATYIRVPKSEEVRDFLRAWEFPRALRQATGIPFNKLVQEGDLQYFGERTGVSSIRYSGWVLDGQVERLLSDKFFAITTFPLNRSKAPARIVVDETRRWEAQLVKSVLTKHLKGPEGYFANRVIFESMTNALRHPSANIIQTASRFDVHYDGSGKPTGKKYFTMAFWDDGESIVATLRRAIIQGLKVRSADVPELYKDYLVKIEPATNERPEPKMISSGYVPNTETSEELLLLSATFPGITRDVVGIGHIAPSDLSENEGSLMLPGMGLYVLTNCVVDIFGGSIAFRTQDFFMNIKRTTEWSKKNRGDQSHYHVKIKRFHSSSPSFLGNMLTIRLPVREPNASE